MLLLQCNGWQCNGWQCNGNGCVCDESMVRIITDCWGLLWFTMIMMMMTLILWLYDFMILILMIFWYDMIWYWYCVTVTLSNDIIARNLVQGWYQGWWIECSYIIRHQTCDIRQLQVNSISASVHHVHLKSSHKSSFKIILNIMEKKALRPS